ncbi:MAG: hypothetical protein C0608_04840 [Deltaproteobacteria bacterium]|nr:MAG: hypothetical protein C0608_04840 [Deltaproteobacteria bacterium]
MLLPIPDVPEIRWTLFYVVMYGLVAFHLWRGDKLGWYGFIYLTLLRVIEGSVWEIMDPIPLYAPLAAGIALLYHGLLLTLLDKPIMRREFFPSGEKPVAILGKISLLIRCSGLALLAYYFGSYPLAIAVVLVWVFVVTFYRPLVALKRTPNKK